MVSFIVQHNLPLAIADELTPLFRKMFPDSEIAKQFQSRGTKSTQIVHAMATDCVEHMTKINGIVPSVACQ